MRDTKSQSNLNGLDVDQYGAFYYATFTCGNCMERNVRYIPKGKSLDTVESFECKNCGCPITPQRQIK